MDKSEDAFRTISEVGEELDLPQHVLRFWETRFTQIKPLKRGGGRRYYRPDDVELVRAIKQLLYGEGYTIKGVQRILKELGVKTVVAASRAARAGGAPLAAAVALPGRLALESDEDEAEAQGAAGCDVERLRAVLADLDECSRLLDLAGGV